MSGSHAGAREQRLADRKRLGWTMMLMASVMVLELAGAWASNSLALLSDAGHMFTDGLALGLAMFAVTMACRPASHKVTYGYYRLEILAALANGILLALISIFLLYKAYQRLMSPQEVRGGIVMIVASVGLLANVVGLYILRGAARHGLNIRGAAMHVMSDALSSGAVIVGGSVIALTGWNQIDPILSAGIALIIIVGAFRLVRESVDVLLETTPEGIDITELREEMLSIEGVSQVHDLHVWSITSGMPAFSGHVVLNATTLAHSDKILNTIKERLQSRFDIGHTTIQIESESYQEIGEVHTTVH